jgi:hypothetical protein
MGQSFDNTAQINSINQPPYSTSGRSPTTDIASPSGGEQILNFEDLLRDQEAGGAIDPAAKALDPQPERRDSGISVGRSQQQRQTFPPQGSESRPGGQDFHNIQQYQEDRRRSSALASNEDLYIAQLQEGARRQSEQQQRAEHALQLQQLARLSSQSQTNFIDHDGYRETANSSSSAASFYPSGSEEISEQEQRDLFQYFQTGIPSGHAVPHQGFQQGAEAGPSNFASVYPQPGSSNMFNHGQDNFLAYRTTPSASVSPQPSPAFRSAHVHELQLNHDPLALDQYEFGRVSDSSGRLGVGSRAVGYGHRRAHSIGAQSVSSYAGSIHGLDALEGLEDQFATGFSSNIDGMDGSEFAAMQADGRFQDDLPPPFTEAQDFMPLPIQNFIYPNSQIRPNGQLGPSRGWSDDDQGASAAMTQWRDSLRAQMPDNNMSQTQPEQMILVNEPASYEPTQGINMNHYQTLPEVPISERSRRLNFRTGSGEEVSEFARRMNSEASDQTMDSMESSGELSANGFQSGNALNGQFQQDVMHILRRQMEGRDQQNNRSFDMGMPPLPVDHHMQPFQNQNRPPDTFRDHMQGQRAPPTFTNSPHFKASGNFSQAKPHSPPALIIPDNNSPSPKPAASQVPYPHQRPADIGPSQLRQNHRPGLIMPGSGSQAGLPPQNNMFLGIPTGGNITMKDAYLSPIGPGGPSINIVPSTPISGLKDGKGIWEKLAVQAQAQQNGQEADKAGRMSSLVNPFGSALDRRRASHSGNYIQRAPTQLDLVASNLALQGLANAPGTAPFVYHPVGPPPVALSAPPIRQRSRSEGQLQDLFLQFDIQQIREMFGEQGASEAASVTGSTSGGTDSRGEVPPGVDPKMVMSASFGTNGNYQYDTSNLRSSSGSDGGHGDSQQSYHSQDAGYASDAAAFAALVNSQGGNAAQNTHVITGVDPHGTTYILTRDGRRLSFDSRMARHLALLDANSPDYRNATAALGLQSRDCSDVNLHSGSVHLDVSNGSRRGRPASRAMGHIRGAHSEDLRHPYDGEGFSDQG